MLDGMGALTLFSEANGATRSDSPRIGMNITYLLGYTVRNGSLGYFSPPTAPSRGHVDTLPPEAALGRAARHSEQSPF